MKTLLWLLAGLTLTTGLSALGDEVEAGHSAHGEAFNEGPRQAAVMMPGTGRVHLQVTTKNADAQKFFDQGLGQLHGFWYFEAERSFRQVNALDPDCAMAFWGMAMANVNNERRAKQFVAKATAIKDKASERERMWIATLENFYRDDKRDKKQRELDYIRDLEALVQGDRKDVEAKAFLVWRIWWAKGDVPITSHQAVDALLDQIFELAPDHPVHHYRIHLWDGVKTELALGSAAQCGQVAPGIAHMWHMPGHTYSKLKRFDDAAWQQEAATRVDHAYMIGARVLPDQIHNYAHNEEWLTRTYNELGRARDAIALAKSLVDIPRHPAFNTLDKASTSSSYGRTRLMDTLLKWELWEDVLRESKGSYLGSVDQPAHQATRLRGLGVAQFHLGKGDELKQTIAALTELKKKEAPAKDDVKKADAPPKEEVRKAIPAAKGELAKGESPNNGKKPSSAPQRKAQGNAEKALAELEALQLILQGKKTEAGKQLDALKDKDVPKERLAGYWLKLGDKTKAADLTSNFPQDLAGSIAKARMLQACGEQEKAKTAFESARKLAFAMDADLPAAQQMKALAKEFGKADDWKAAIPQRTDVGKRPPLASLGPVHWHPPTAPEWEASVLDGATTGSKAIKGKATVLIFYLGADCPHCVTQIKVFAKAAADFEKAGIQIQAITLEKPEQAKAIFKESPTPGKLPFPIATDPELRAFKRFGAYDDFEKEALHATVFIDARQQLRWIDVSYQPFTNTRFLLDECQRLMKLPAPTPGAVTQAAR